MVPTMAIQVVLTMVIQVVLTIVIQEALMMVIRIVQYSHTVGPDGPMSIVNFIKRCV